MHEDFIMNDYFKKLLFVLLGLITGYLQAFDNLTEAEEIEKKRIEKNNQRRREKHNADLKKNASEYFEAQKALFKNVSSIPGANPLTIDESFAEKLLADCPKDIEMLMSEIEESIESNSKIQKKIILCGQSSVGKTSLAQAIAIKNRIPCLFFNAQYVSNHNNMSTIFECIKNLEKKSNKPCVVIFDNLQALVRDNSNNNNKYLEFQDNLNSLMRDGIIVVGTMDVTDDLPQQIIEKISATQIEVPLSDEKQTRKVLLDFFKRKKINPESDSILDNLVKKMNGYSYSKLDYEVGKIAYSLRNKQQLDTGYKVFTNEEYIQFAKNIKKSCKRKPFISKNISFQHVVGVSTITVATLALASNVYFTDKKIKQDNESAEKGRKTQEEIAAKGREQSEKQFKEKMEQDNENAEKGRTLQDEIAAKNREQSEKQFKEKMENDNENAKKGRGLTERQLNQAKAESEYQKSWSYFGNKILTSFSLGAANEAGRASVKAVGTYLGQDPNPTK